jgi:hypothetical protein
MTSVTTKLAHVVLAALGIGSIVAYAQDGPPGLARLVAARESLTAEAQSQYTYRQTVVVEEFDNRGLRGGQYKEVRDIVFSPTGERSEKVILKPSSTLVRLVLTEEDFRDIRAVQPLLLTKEAAFLYETRYQGEETIDGLRCYVLRIRPRQVLAGQRLFDGLIWIDPSDYSIVRSEGKAVPEVVTMKSEDLFPRFTTTRAKFDGKYWFPTLTSGDDKLEFRSGPVRMRLTIRYENYQRFSSDVKITFEK